MRMYIVLSMYHDVSHLYEFQTPRTMDKFYLHRHEQVVAGLHIFIYLMFAGLAAFVGKFAQGDAETKDNIKVGQHLTMTVLGIAMVVPLAVAHLFLVYLALSYFFETIRGSWKSCESRFVFLGAYSSGHYHEPC